MPPVVIAAVAAVASAIVATAPAIIAALGVTGAIIAGAVVGAVVAAGLGMAFNALSGKPSAAPLAAKATDQKIMIRGSVVARRVIYGEAKVSGPIAYATSTGANKEVMHLVVLLAGHAVQDIGTIWINDDPIEPGEISDGSVVAGKFAGKVMIGKYDGTHTNADLTLISETTDGWDANHKLLGIAYVYIRLVYTPDLFQGLPNISARVLGKRDILDPRTGATGYTTNWALCVLDYLRADFGLACASDELDLDSFISAANLSDEAVPLNASGTVTQPRYTANGSFTLDVAPIDVMEDMLASGAGALLYVAGQYRLMGGAYLAPSATLTASDFAGPVEVQTMPPRDALFNSVKGTFIDPERFYQPSEFPPMQDPTAVAEDGEEIWREIELPFVTDATRAQRLARQVLFRTRNPLTVRARLRYASIQHSIWQTVAVTLDDLGWTAKPFRIAGFSFNPADGSCSVTLTEEQVASYAWLYDAAIGVADNPNTSLIDPLTIPAPTGLVVTPSTAQQADGTIAPALQVTWTAAAHAFVSAHEVQWQGPDGIWNSRDVAMPTTILQIAPVLSGVAYIVRVRAVAGLVRGPFTATANSTAGADTTPPAVPTALAATGAFKGISVTWTMPADRDLAAIEVYEATTSSPTGRVYVGESMGSGFRRDGLSPGVTRFYWVRSRDQTRNLSAFAGPVSATSSSVGTADFAAGIQPVTIVSSVPAAYITDFILNTADRKTYRWNGTAYTAAVQAVDLTGSLTDAQIASLDAAKLSGTLPNSIYGTTNRPIEILGALPSSGNFLGRVVQLTTDSKIYRWTSATTTGTTFWSKATDGADIIGASITGQAIAGSTITGDNIAANTLTGKNMVLGDFSNRAENGTFAAGAVSWTASGGGLLPAGVSIVTNDAANAFVGTSYLRIATGTAAGVQARNVNIFEALPGDKYYLRARAKSDTGTTQALQVRIAWLTAAQAATGSVSALNFAVGTSYAMQENQGLTVPAGAAFGVVEVFTAGAVSVGGWRVGEVYCTKQGGGELIIDGSLTASKANIADFKAGVLTAGSITTAMLSVGSGNLIWNSTCTRTSDGWIGGTFGGMPAATLGASIPAGLSAWGLRGLGSGFIRLATTVPFGAGAIVDWRPDSNFLGIPCIAGDRVQARALLGAHRCTGSISMIFFDAGNGVTGAFSTTPSSLPGGLNDSDYVAHTLLQTAPAGTVLVVLRVNLLGNGGNDAFVFWTKAMLGLAPQNATEVGIWEPGGLTDISGGMLRTNTVDARVINAASIFSDAGVFNNLTAGIAAFGGLSAAEISATEVIITGSLQLGDTIVSTAKLQGSSVTDIGAANQFNNVLINSPVNPGDMFAQVGLVGLLVIVPAGSDGKVIVHCNPCVEGTSSYVWDNAGGGGGGGGGDGGGS